MKIQRSILSFILIFIFTVLYSSLSSINILQADNSPTISRVGRIPGPGEVDINGDDIYFEYPTISRDGTLLAYTSTDSTIVPGDNNNTDDIFVKNRSTNTTSKLTINAFGNNPCNNNGPENRFVGPMQFSADNQFLIFRTCRTLVAEDTNTFVDVYLYNFLNNSVELISKSTLNIASDGNSGSPSVSGDGRFVTFQSYADNLVDNDTNGFGDVFIRDRQLNITERVSIGTNSEQGNEISGIVSPTMAVSDDGRYVVFDSRANFTVFSNLAPINIYLRDRANNTTELINKSINGTPAHAESLQATMSSDGNIISFESYDPNLIPDNPGPVGTNGDPSRSVYVLNRSTNSFKRIQEPGGGTTVKPLLSANGQYLLIGSQDTLYRVSLATDSITRLTNDWATPNAPPNSGIFTTISADGDLITFESRSSNIIPADGVGGSFLISFVTTPPADITPPVVVGTPDRQPNANGWYNTNVTIDWQATDPTPSSGTPTDPPNTTATTEGAGVTYTSQNSCDPAGNCATGSTQLSIDKTAPTGAFTGSTLIIRLLGGNIHGTAGDGLSGVDEVRLTVGATTFSSKTGGITLTCNAARTSCTWSVTNSFALPLGSNPYTLTTIDKASNQTTTSRTYLII